MAWHEVASEDAIGEDEAIGVTINGREVAICRTGGALHALDNVCTHQYALLSEGYVEDGCIECPLHQGRFDVKTGEAQGAPVSEPIKVHALKVEGGKVFVELKD